MSEPQKALTVVNQPGPSKPLSSEERKQLLTRLRRNLGRSRLEVQGPSDMWPYWARINDNSEMSRLESFGFRVVVDNPKSPRYQASGFRDDGTYILGDVILMEAPIEAVKFLEEQNLETARNLVASAKQGFKEEAEKAGVPTFEVNPKVKEVSN